MNLRMVTDANGRELDLIGIFEKSHGRECVDVDGFAYWEFDQPEKVLEQVVTEGEMFGFVLHGGTNRINGEIIPKTAKDLIREQGRRLAIYATNNPAKVMFWALTGGTGDRGRKEIGGRLKIDDDKKISYENLRFVVENKSHVREMGWVYIFENSGWEYSLGEYLSYESKTPVAIIKINRNDFKYPIEVAPIARENIQVK
ncbi:hypothetical protein HYU91_04700 [Candidatus Collierbacteria bacterium]|nr:hypothetical protein [Candidatus Collierbacteria bacterium]